MMGAIRDHVLPRYEGLPHFQGMTAIEANAGTRAEVVVTSYWDDGLEDSVDAAAEFIEAITEVTGMNPSRRNFDTLYAEVRDSTGTFRPWPSGVVP